MQTATAIRPKRLPTGSSQYEHDSVKPAADGKPELAALVRSVVTRHADPAQVLELYYWSLDPDLTDLMRALIAVPQEARAALLAFLAKAPDLPSVRAALDRSGQLTLVSPQQASARIALPVATTSRRAAAALRFASVVDRAVFPVLSGPARRRPLRLSDSPLDHRARLG